MPHLSHSAVLIDRSARTDPITGNHISTARRALVVPVFDRRAHTGDDAGVRYHGHLPFEGEIVWLTPEQGGRVSGPPPTPLEHDYVATALVPPHTTWSGLASFVLRVDDRRAWRSRAFAGWLVVDNADDHAVAPGVLIAVTEGSRQVGFFRVNHVHADPVPVALRALDLRSLVGCTEADARRRVEGAGGVFRTYDNKHPTLNADYRANRVTARIEDDIVAEVNGFS